MMANCFFDTNIFLYAAMHQLRPDDEHKRPIADKLLYEEDYCLSAQVVAEFYHNALRKGKKKLTHEEASDWIERMILHPCLAVDVDLVQAGTAFSQRYQVSYWDGAMLAAAEQLGAATFYSEDLNDGQRYGNVTVINPFKSVPN
jgi:predicted nucleic acid-binding protein